MKRPKRTIRRESAVMYRGRPLVLIVPPTCERKAKRGRK